MQFKIFLGIDGPKISGPHAGRRKWLTSMFEGRRNWEHVAKNSSDEGSLKKKRRCGTERNWPTIAQ